ncbi:Vacuolar protein sorting/targeting protein 10, partial [Dissostichus eleginoides]
PPSPLCKTPGVDLSRPRGYRLIQSRDWVAKVFKPERLVHLRGYTSNHRAPHCFMAMETL